ncbi:hypothetical protein DJ93_998 [Bacillus clarus]|uniref:Uncharacterized protein n=1 Tax=Bacillus clarus TaxID=2338372 RepID=A0A090YY04_9BACI|nr:hypothetical protein DJ93_998 [Bacillus clarus]
MKMGHYVPFLFFLEGLKSYLTMQEKRCEKNSIL